MKRSTKRQIRKAAKQVIVPIAVAVVTKGAVKI